MDETSEAETAGRDLPARLSGSSNTGRAVSVTNHGHRDRSNPRRFAEQRRAVDALLSGNQVDANTRVPLKNVDLRINLEELAFFLR